MEKIPKLTEDPQVKTPVLTVPALKYPELDCPEENIRFVDVAFASELLECVDPPTIPPTKNKSMTTHDVRRSTLVQTEG